MKKFAVIVGGGRGVRLGSEIPKQFLLLKNRPVIFHTIEKFQGIADEIVLVLPESHFDYWEQLCEKYQPGFTITLERGGDSRSESVLKGLLALKGTGIVAVHDAVRPLVSGKLINKLFETAAQYGNAVPVMPVKESLRERLETTSKAVNRENFMIVQTPQCFDLQNLITAYQQSEGLQFSDDAGLIEHQGITIHHIEGEASNLKITFKEDLLIAEALMTM